MKKLIFTFLFLPVISICYSQENQEVTSTSQEVVSDSLSVIDESQLPTEEAPIVIKYYQTTEPEIDEVEENIELKYYDERENDDDNDNWVVYSDPKVETYSKQEEKVQPRTLYSGNGHSGGFGAIGFKTSQADNDLIMLAGLRGAWVINRSFAIGLDMWGVLPTDNYAADYDISNNLALLGGYGGLYVAPILFSNDVVHLTFPFSMGAGWLGLQEYDDEYDGGDYELLAEDVFWYVEPGASLEVNVASFFRINFGASHMFTQGLDLQVPNYAEMEVLDGWNFFVMLKFGRF
ncbi:MAG: hypothetical protein OCD76_16825 [Reichenbachiella sp.]